MCFLCSFDVMIDEIYIRGGTTELLLCMATLQASLRVLLLYQAVLLIAVTSTERFQRLTPLPAEDKKGRRRE